MAKSPAVTKNYTPQQVDFALRYFLPTSDTYNNAKQSAIAAGYTEEYADVITTRGLEWLQNVLSDIIGRDTNVKNMFLKARKVINKSMDSKREDIALKASTVVVNADPEFSKKLDLTTGGEKINPIHELSVEELRKLAK